MIARVGRQRVGRQGGNQRWAWRSAVRADDCRSCEGAPGGRSRTQPYPGRSRPPGPPSARAVRVWGALTCHPRFLATWWLGAEKPPNRKLRTTKTGWGLGAVADLELDLAWKPKGPASLVLWRSQALIQGIMGPIGSGKTTTILRKGFLRATQMAPSPIDGVRRYCLTVVRDTYRNLWGTTLKTWRKVFDDGNLKGSPGGPATHRILADVDYSSGQSLGPVEMIFEFRAVGENSAEQALKGIESTDFFLNEADLLSRDTFEFVIGRAGRYPDPKHGVPPSYHVMVDFNAPIRGNWCALGSKEQPGLLKLSRAGGDVEIAIQAPSMIEQGGALVTNPEAENIENLPPGYYENQLRSAPNEMYVRRMLRNQLGYSQAGKPIYTQFRDDLHVATRDLEPTPGLDLLLGADAGRTPAMVVGQIDPHGQLRILDELVAEGVGARRFGDLINQFLAERYEPWTRPNMLDGKLPIRAFCDPAAANPTESDDEAWMQILRSRTGIRWRPAQTNVPTKRWEAVRVYLTTTLELGRPGLLLSPRCEVLRDGFTEGYRFRKIQFVGEARYDENADKNAYSHPHDALQYLALGAGGYDATMDRRDRRRGLGRQQQRAITDENSTGRF